MPDLGPAFKPAEIRRDWGEMTAQGLKDTWAGLVDFKRSEIFNALDIPRFAVKLGVVYNNFWLKKEAGTTSSLQAQQNSLQTELSTHNRDLTEAQKIATELGMTSDGGALSKMIDKRDVLLNQQQEGEKQLRQSQAESARLIERRGGIADKFLAKYEAKMAPAKQEIAKLEQLRHQQVEEFTQKQAAGRQALAEMQEKENKLNRLVQLGGDANNKEVLNLRGKNAELRQQIDLNEQQMSRASEELGRKIAKHQKNVYWYTKKQEWFKIQKGDVLPEPVVPNAKNNHPSTETGAKPAEISGGAEAANEAQPKTKSTAERLAELEGDLARQKAENARLTAEREELRRQQSAGSGLEDKKESLKLVEQLVNKLGLSPEERKTTEDANNKYTADMVLEREVQPKYLTAFMLLKIKNVLAGASEKEVENFMSRNEEDLADLVNDVKSGWFKKRDKRFLKSVIGDLNDITVAQNNLEQAA